MAKNLASLTLMLGANIGQFQTSMRKASKELETVGKKMQSIGKSMSLYVTAPLVAMGTASVMAFDEAAQANARLATQLRQNGKDVQTTLADYNAFASGIERVTTVDDEAVLGMMQLAESMGAIDVKGATSGAIALSKSLGIDLTAAMKMAVLAQNGQYTMLQRYVPALRVASSETEKAAIVQKLFADGMAIAKSEAGAGLGPMLQLKNALGNLGEGFGKIITEALAPAISWLKELVIKFDGLSDRGKTIIIVIASIAAAIGPLLLGLGALVIVLPFVATGLSAVATAFAAINWQIVLIVAIIAAIAAAFIYVYGNWQAFKDRLGDWSWLKNAAIDSLKAIISASTFFINEIAKLFGIDFVAKINTALDGLKSPITKSKTEFKSFGTTMKDVVKGVMGSFGLLKDKSTEDLKAVETQAVKTTAAVTALGKAIDTRLAPTAISSSKTVTTTTSEFSGKESSSAAAVTSQKSWGSKMPTAEEHAEWQKNLIKTEKVALDVSDSVQGGMTNMAIGIANAFAGLMAGTANIGDFFNSILSVVADFMKQLGEQLIAVGMASKAFKTLITNPYAAIAAGLALITLSAIVQGTLKKGPGMIEGGVVPSGYPNDGYNARLTSGEIVAPPQKLENFFAQMMNKMATPIPLNAMSGGGDMHVTVSGRLMGHGKDLVSVLEGAQINRTRVRGY